MKYQTINQSFFAALILLFSSQSFAQSKCFDFDTTKNSHKLVSLTVAIPQVNSKKNQVALVSGQVKEGKPIYVQCQCQLKNRKIDCVQNDGGGDFSIILNDPLRLELTYINLAIGALSGTAPAKEDVELNEDFAVFQEDEKDEHSDHLEAFQLVGSARDCRETDLSVQK